MRKLSVTTKITIWYTAIMLFITVSVLSVLVYTGNLRSGESAKTLLEEAVTDASLEVERYGENFVVDEKLKFYDDGVYISIYDGDGELIEGKRPAELTKLPDFDDRETRKLTDDNGDRWYVYDSLFEVDNHFVWVRGIVKDFTDKGTFAFIQRLVIFAIPGMVAIAALGGYLITRRAFRPVREVIGIVEEIKEDGDLSRRIDVAEDVEDSGDEIQKLAGTFNGMFDKLEKSFEQEKQFTSDVSHELRTPLAVIISQSEYAKGDKAYASRALEVIEREAKRMSQLVNRLLTLSRSDAGRLNLDKERIDFTEMCRTIADQQTVVAEGENITVKTDIEEGIVITGDEAMVIRIILNLMDNAIKYGRNEGTVKLSLFREGDFAVCAVEDDGIGIGEEDLNRIWERFYRVGKSRSEESAGLGLAMVEALTKAHGGKVAVNSTLGTGSCFKVYFPLDEFEVDD